jgi:DNA repair protein RadC
MRDGIETVEEGSIGYAAVYPRRIIEAALRRGAASMVFAHNHPGGTPTPSEDDKAITRKLAQAASAVEIQVLDHLIVAGNEVFSFRLHGLL